MRHASPVYEAEPAEHMSAGRYLATRFSTLKPPMAKTPNPFKALASLSGMQWLFFLVSLFRRLHMDTIRI